MSDFGFRSAAVIGTGMMGPGIALTLALGGVPATIIGRSEESAERGLAKARKQAAVLRDNTLIDVVLAEAAVAGLAASTSFDSVVRTADLVIESAPENLRFKQDLFRRMDVLAHPDAVLASNTSGLSITAIATDCTRPERVLTTHFWNPPHLVPLVEIVKGERTSDAVIERVRGQLDRCGKKTVVVKKDRPGQLGNRLQMALLREAAYMIAEGIATAEDIDTAIRSGLGLRYPAYSLLEHQDLVGLDLSLAVCDYVSTDLFGEPNAPQYLRNLVAAGNLGARTGCGFHDWSQRDPNAVRARRDAFLIEFLRAERRKAEAATDGR